MKIQNLKLKNFIGWKDLTIDFVKYHGVIPIIADDGTNSGKSNGMGKSSILQAILFALYGDVRGKAIDDMIHNDDPDGLYLSMLFSYDGKVYRVERKKKQKGAQKCNLYSVDKDNETLMGSDVEKLLNLPSFDIYSNTVFSKQGDLAGFVLKTPSIQKDILQQMFTLDKFTEYEDKARSLLTIETGTNENLEGQFSVLSKSTESLSMDIKNIDKQISDLNYDAKSVKELEDKIKTIESISNKILDFIAQKQEVMVRLNSNIEKIKLLIGKKEYYEKSISENNLTISSTVRNIEQYKSKLIQYEQSLNEINDVLKNINNPDHGIKEGRLSEIKKTRDSILEEMAKYKASMDVSLKEKKKISSLDNKCGTCGNTITPEYKKDAIQKIDISIEHLKMEIGRGEIAYKNANVNLERQEKEEKELMVVMERKVSAENDRKKTIDNIESMNNIIKTFEQSISICKINNDKASDDISNITKELVELKSLVDSDAATSSEIRVLQEQRSNAINEIKRIDDSLGEYRLVFDKLNGLKGQKDNIIGSIKKIVPEIKDISQKVNICKDKIETLKDVVRAFGPSGIPALVIDNRLAELQSYIDAYIELLSDGRISIKINTTKVSSTGKLSDTIQFMVNDGTNVRDVSTYSGGEQVRVFLAIRLALARMLSFRSDALKGLLVIDELNELDEAGLDMFVKLLESISGEYEQILLVSHIDKLKTSFESCINIVPDRKGVFNA